jgi:hypothetical protein
MELKTSISVNKSLGEMNETSLQEKILSREVSETNNEQMDRTSLQEKILNREVSETNNERMDRTSLQEKISSDVTDYKLNKCAECDKYVTDIDYCCTNCDTYYCQFHYAINISMMHCTHCEQLDPNNTINERKLIPCIIDKCTETAEYGFKNIICYCLLHAKGKKVIKYNCFCTSGTSYGTYIYEKCKLPAIYINLDTSSPVCKKHSMETKNKSYLYVDLRNNT